MEKFLLIILCAVNMIGCAQIVPGLVMVGEEVVEDVVEREAEKEVEILQPLEVSPIK